MRDVLATVPTPPPEDLSDRDDPPRQPAPRGLRDPRGGRPRRGACASPSRARRRGRALCGRAGDRPAARARATLRRPVQRRGRAHRRRSRASTRRSWFGRRAPSTGSSSCSTCRRASRSRETMPFAVRLARRRGAHDSRCGSRCSRWGVYDVGMIEARARDPFRLVVWEERFQRIRQLKAYPHSETLARVLDAAETQAFTGSAVARVKGDGIEYADIRDYVPGRPPALDQLARVRPSNGPRRQRAPPGAKHRRRALRGQLRGSARREPKHARRRGARRGDARDPLSRAQRPRRPGRRSEGSCAGCGQGWGRLSASG